MPSNTINTTANAVRQLKPRELEVVSGGQNQDPYHMPMSNKVIGVVVAQAGVGAALLGAGGGKK